MNKIKVIFFGEKPLALKCLKILQKRNDVKLLGIVTRRNGNFWWNQDKLIQFAKCRKIKIIKENNLHTLKPDIIISVLYPFILSKKILDKAKICVNLHQAPLPELKGKYSNYHCIVNGMQYFGSTLHVMNEELDSGKIIDKKIFKVDESDTALELYKKNDLLAYQIFKNNIDDIIKFKLKTYDQNKKIKSKSFGVKSIKNKISNLKNVRKLWNFVRANEFPPFEPAYIEYRSKKIYLMTKPEMYIKSLKKKLNEKKKIF